MGARADVIPAPPKRTDYSARKAICSLMDILSASELTGGEHPIELAEAIIANRVQTVTEFGVIATAITDPVRHEERHDGHTLHTIVGIIGTMYLIAIDLDFLTILFKCKGLILHTYNFDHFTYLPFNFHAKFDSRLQTHGENRNSNHYSTPIALLLTLLYNHSVRYTP